MTVFIFLMLAAVNLALSLWNFSYDSLLNYLVGALNFGLALFMLLFAWLTRK